MVIYASGLIKKYVELKDPCIWKAPPVQETSIKAMDSKHEIVNSIS
jgi:hypothetical protein